MGNSKFALTVYDSLCDYHFRDMDGLLTLDDFILLTDGSTCINLSSISGTLIKGN